MARLNINIEAEITGASRTTVLEALYEQFTEAIDVAVEGGDYYMTHPETDREFDNIEVSVNKVELHAPSKVKKDLHPGLEAARDALKALCGTVGAPDVEAGLDMALDAIEAILNPYVPEEPGGNEEFV